MVFADDSEVRSSAEVLVQNQNYSSTVSLYFLHLGYGNL